MRARVAGYAGERLRFGDRYLQLFFKEKQLPVVWWNLRSKDGTSHTMSNQTVLEFIAQAPSSEKKGIGNMIRKIDFANGDVNDYLKHLAGAIINGPMAPKLASDTRLRSKLIRLAHSKPELRQDLLPLLRAARSKRAAGTLLRKMPDNTQVNGFDTWGSWDGDLAMVEEPWGTSITPADFDVDRMARHYSVRFALDIRRRTKIPADRTNLGHNIVVRDRSANYEKTTWSIGTGGFGPVQQGTFSKHYDFWVQVKPKELSKGEVYAVIEKLDRKGWYDVTGQPNKLGKRQWQALLKGSFADAQEQSPEMANAADRAVTWVNKGYADSPAKEEQVWRSIQGVYKLNQARNKLMWMIPRK